MLGSCCDKGSFHQPTTQLLQLVIPPLLAVQLPTLSQDPRRTILPPRPRSRPPPTPPLLLRKYLTNCPTVGFLSTRDLTYLGHAQSLSSICTNKWQLLEIEVVVQNLIESTRFSLRVALQDKVSLVCFALELTTDSFLNSSLQKKQVHVIQLREHIEFQTTTATDCIRQTSVV